jgi:tight adherence protein C
MTDDSTFLVALLAAELVACAWLVLFFRLRARSRVTTQRINKFSTARISGAPSSEVKPSLFVQLCLSDLTQSQREAIPWIFGSGPVAGGRHETIFAATRTVFSAIAWLTGYLLFAFLFSQRDVPVAISILSSGALGAVAWWGASRYLSGLLQDRRNSVSAGMPYALDLILICLDSGTALETAIARVADELSARDPLVSAELLRTLTDINVVGNRELAFRNLADRVGTDNMHSIVGVLCQSLQYGSSISIALKGAIENMKRVELITLEERAGKLPVQLTMPGLVFTFPQVIVLLAGPGVLSLVDTLANT